MAIWLLIYKYKQKVLARNQHLRWKKKNYIKVNFIKIYDPLLKKMGEISDIKIVYIIETRNICEKC